MLEKGSIMCIIGLFLQFFPLTLVNEFTSYRTRQVSKLFFAQQMSIFRFLTRAKGDTRSVCNILSLHQHITLLPKNEPGPFLGNLSPVTKDIWKVRIIFESPLYDNQESQKSPFLKTQEVKIQTVHLDLHQQHGEEKMKKHCWRRNYSNQCKQISRAFTVRFWANQQKICNSRNGREYCILDKGLIRLPVEA